MEERENLAIEKRALSIIAQEDALEDTKAAERSIKRARKGQEESLDLARQGMMLSGQGDAARMLIMARALVNTMAGSGPGPAHE